MAILNQVRKLLNTVYLTNSRINTKEQFENIIVRNRPSEGSIVYLKDVARVELGKFDYTVNAFVNGKPAAFVLIYQAPGANALETYKGVNKALTEMKKIFQRILITWCRLKQQL